MSFFEKHIKPINDRVLFRITLITIFSLAISQLIFFALQDIRKVLIITPDDASYFYKIAQNFVNGNGFSFDGINETNGFQPLWLYFIIVIRYFIDFSPEINYRLYLLLQILILLVASRLIFSIQTKLFDRNISSLSIFIFCLLVFLQAINGMETALLILAISILFYYGWASKVFSRSNSIKDFALGLILGLLFLARLDMIFLIISLYIFLFLIYSKKENGYSIILKKLSLISVGAGLLAIPYLLYNYINFDNIQPISGVLKSSDFQPTFNFNFSFTVSNYVIVFSAVPIALLYLVRNSVSLKSIAKLPDSLFYFRTVMLILSLSIILHFSYYVFFTTWEHINWHYTYYGLFLSLMSAELTMAFSSKSKQWIFEYSKLTLFSIGLIYLTIKTYNRFNLPLDKNWHSVAYQSAIWAKSNTNNDDIFAMTDAGNFSYFSERRVINLDGIVNNFEFQQYLKEKKFSKYLKRYNVRYIVNADIQNREEILSLSYTHYPINFFSYKYLTESDTIILKKDNQIYRQKYFNGRGETAFVIWKL